MLRSRSICYHCAGATLLQPLLLFVIWLIEAFTGCALNLGVHRLTVDGNFV